MDAVEVLALQQEFVTAHVPGDVTGIGLDLLVWRFGNKAFLGLLEVALILERQRGLDAFAQFDRELGGRFAERMEMGRGVTRYVFARGGGFIARRLGSLAHGAQRHDGGEE